MFSPSCVYIYIYFYFYAHLPLLTLAVACIFPFFFFLHEQFDVRANFIFRERKIVDLKFSVLHDDTCIHIYVLCAPVQRHESPGIRDSCAHTIHKAQQRKEFVFFFFFF